MQTATVTKMPARTTHRTVHAEAPQSRREVTCSTCNLRELCLPAGLSVDDLKRVEKVVNLRRRLKRGEVLFGAGDSFHSIFAIRSGFFKTSVVDREGREQVTGFSMGGELLGIDGLGGGQYNGTAVALEDCEVCVMPFAMIEEISHDIRGMQRIYGDNFEPNESVAQATNLGQIGASLVISDRSIDNGVGNFFPSFLIRSHGLTVAQVGVVLALVSGIGGALGTYLGGYLGDRFGAQDPRWYLWVPMLGGLVAFVPYLYVLLTDNTLHLLVILVFTNILTAMYLGPCIALSHALVPPNMRALTSAILFFVLNMIGLGLGPFLTGLASDLLTPRFGTDGLRYAMVLASLFGLVAIGLFYFAARQLPADLAKRRRSAETFSVV